MVAFSQIHSCGNVLESNVKKSKEIMDPDEDTGLLQLQCDRGTEKLKLFSVPCFYGWYGELDFWLFVN